MDRVVNFQILSNPLNWIIIFLVLYLVALIAKLLVGASTNAPIQLPVGL